MKYEISYAKTTNAAEKAIEDCKDYLGAEYFNRIVLELQKFKKDENDTVEQATRCLHLLLSFAGIQGYPVTCLIEKYCNLD